MKKRIFSLITLVAMLVSLSITASAEVLWNYDFSDASQLSEWKNGYKDGSYVLDNGAVKHTATGTYDFYTASLSESISGQDIVWEFDFKTDTHNKWSLQAYTGAHRMYWSFKTNEGFVLDSWQNVLIHFPAEQATATSPVCYVYFKDAGASEWRYSATRDMTVRTNKPYFKIVGYAGNAWIDNIKIYTGTNATNRLVEVNANPVEAIENIEAGTLKASTEIWAAKEKTNLRKIMVAYDKTGKMLDCSTGTQNLVVGSNAVSGTLTLDETEAAAVADKGYVGLYLWDGMRPYIDAVELQ